MERKTPSFVVLSHLRSQEARRNSQRPQETPRNPRPHSFFPSRAKRGLRETPPLPPLPTLPQASPPVPRRGWSCHTCRAQVWGHGSAMARLVASGSIDGARGSLSVALQQVLEIGEGLVRR